MVLQAGFEVINNNDDSNSDNMAITTVHNAFSQSASAFPLSYVDQWGSREEKRQDSEHLKEILKTPTRRKERELCSRFRLTDNYIRKIYQYRKIIYDFLKS